MENGVHPSKPMWQKPSSARKNAEKIKNALARKLLENQMCVTSREFLNMARIPMYNAEVGTGGRLLSAAGEKLPTAMEIAQAEARRQELLEDIPFPIENPTAAQIAELLSPKRVDALTNMIDKAFEAGRNVGRSEGRAEQYSPPPTHAAEAATASSNPLKELVQWGDVILRPVGNGWVIRKIPSEDYRGAPMEVAVVEGDLNEVAKHLAAMKVTAAIKEADNRADNMLSGMAQMAGSAAGSSLQINTPTGYGATARRT